MGKMNTGLKRCAGYGLALAACVLLGGSCGQREKIDIFRGKPFPPQDEVCAFFDNTQEMLTFWIGPETPERKDRITNARITVPGEYVIPFSYRFYKSGYGDGSVLLNYRTSDFAPYPIGQRQWEAEHNIPLKKIWPSSGLLIKNNTMGKTREEAIKALKWLDWIADYIELYKGDTGDSRPKLHMFKHMQTREQYDAVKKWRQERIKYARRLLLDPKTLKVYGGLISFNQLPWKRSPQEQEYNQKKYLVRQEGGDVAELIKCSAAGYEWDDEQKEMVLRGKGTCQHYFLGEFNGNFLHIKISYDRHYLPEWKKRRQDVMQFIKCMNPVFKPDPNPIPTRELHKLLQDAR